MQFDFAKMDIKFSNNLYCSSQGAMGIGKTFLSGVAQITPPLNLGKLYNFFEV